MIQGLFQSGAMPVLERVAQFTGARHKLIAGNIANLSTPFYKPRDLDVSSFQASLLEAVDRRRASADPVSGPLGVRDTEEVRFGASGLEGRGSDLNEGVLFHDQNNRDLERVMQDLAENTLAHNAAIEMLRNQFSMLETAIREQV